MVLDRLSSLFVISSVILLFTVFFGCVSTDTPVSLYRPTAQNQANLTVDEWIERGDNFYFGDDYENARECYFRALMADPNRIDVLNSYGVTLANTGFYENALVIFNLALKIDPYDETVRDNISFCRQQIAARTEQQRQLQLQAQKEQQESFNNIIASLNTLASSIQQQQQNQSGGHSEGKSQSGTSNGSSSADAGNYQMRYDRFAKHVESTANSLDRMDKTKSSYNRMVRTLRDYQRDMRHIRRECESKRIPLRPRLDLENYEP